MSSDEHDDHEEFQDAPEEIDFNALPHQQLLKHCLHFKAESERTQGVNNAIFTIQSRIYN